MRYLGSIAGGEGSRTTDRPPLVMAFVVGREFADGTISGLFALPVARATIAAAQVIDRLARLFVLTVLSGALAVPAAWAATLGRGLLPGIAITIGLIASAQVLVVAGAGAWYPAVAPAWTRLQLDR